MKINQRASIVLALSFGLARGVFLRHGARYLEPADAASCSTTGDDDNPCDYSAMDAIIFCSIIGAFLACGCGIFVCNSFRFYGRPNQLNEQLLPQRAAIQMENYPREIPGSESSTAVNSRQGSVDTQASVATIKL